ncbi:MAG: hypothetical protein Kow0069_33490 [Promethearchaeota archaeon]
METKREEIADVEKWETEAKVSDSAKMTQKTLAKILEYTQFDRANRAMRDLLDKFNLLDKTDRMFYWNAWVYVRQLMRTAWSFRITGEMFPEYGPGIVVANHQSHIDPFFVSCAIHRRVRWMSKDENFQTPIVTSLFTNLGAFSVRRGTSDEVAWETAKQILRNGEWVGIFPEGTRSVNGVIGPFRSGAVRLAIEEGVPIVPCAVFGSRDVLPKGQLVMKRAKVTVRVGKAIKFDEYYGKELSYQKARELAAQVREKVLELVEMQDYEDDAHRLRVAEGSVTGQDAVAELAASIGSEPDEKKSGGPLAGVLSALGLGGGGNPLKALKRLGKQALQVVDDAWYALLRSLEPWNLREHFQDAVYNFSGNVVATYCKLLNPMRMIGFSEYTPKSGAALVCANHNSEWDVIVLATAIQQAKRRHLWQMSKQSLFKIPVVNAWVRNHYAFPLRRGESDVDSYNYALHLLRNGHLVCMYPEGTTNPGNGQLLPGHTGAMRLAIEAKVPIIPVGITGTERIYPKHAKMLNFGKGCVLKMGPAWTEHAKYFDAEEPPAYEELKKLTDRLMATIADLLLYNNPEA